MTNTSLPESSWQLCEALLQRVAEGDEVELSSLAFLTACGLVDITGHMSALTALGKDYYDARFIRNDQVVATAVLRESLLLHPAAQAILQLLHGVQNANRANALSILKSRGIWSYAVDERPLTNLLLTMNAVELISYSKKHGSVRVLHNPSDEANPTPANIFIDPKRPYGNKTWLKKVLAECRGYIHWIDKHFTAAGLEYIWEIADANNVCEITILSLYLPDVIGKRAVKDYKDLQSELASKGIKLSWYVIDSSFIRDNHDRWILSGSQAWNLPDLNTIMSGSRSEISKSPNGPEMEKAFTSYLKQAKEISMVFVSSD